MAGYDDKANTSYGGVSFDTEGREHSAAGYAKAHNHVAASGNVSGYRKGIESTDPYKGHGIRDEFILMPWCQSSANDQPLKDDGNFSKVYDHVGHRQNYKGPAHNRVSLSSQLAIYDRSKGLLQNRDRSDVSQLAVFDRSKDSPPRKDANKKSKVTPPPLKDRNSPVSVGMQQPQHNGSPKKDHGYDQSIHNKASHPTGAYAGDNYKGIAIDAKEATEEIQGCPIMMESNRRCRYY